MYMNEDILQTIMHDWTFLKPKGQKVNTGVKVNASLNANLHRHFVGCMVVRLFFCFFSHCFWLCFIHSSY